MRNLFDFATKELSQDAFIRWLFENYEDNTIKIVLNDFIEFLLGKRVEIKSVYTESQHKSIDIYIEITLVNGQKEYIYIEDKTFSNEHSQLIAYNNVINEDLKKNQMTKDKAHKIFYKTSDVKEWESQRVVDAGWEQFDIFKICKFWKKYESCSVLLIQWYALHVIDLNYKFSNREIKNQMDELLWYGYYNNELVKCVNKKYICWTNIARYGYSYFGSKPNDPIIGEDGMPYLEIRNRDIDLKNKTFIVRILTYDMEKHFLEENVKRIKTLVKESIKKCRYGYKLDSKDKQIANKVVSFENQEDFNNKVLEINEEFRNIMLSSKIDVKPQLFYKNIDEKIKILKDVCTYVKNYNSKNVECDLYNADKRKKTKSAYISMYINLVEIGLTIETYFMIGPTDNSYEGNLYEEDNVLYVALWNRFNKDYNFDKYISNESIKIVTTGKGSWGKHYILKKFNLTADTFETIVKNVKQYLIDYIKNIKLER